ncbi:phasin family protein [Microvirga sp. 2MCAF38]|uniref:phasin family protein n=1 Tax=Microvirga sp. 2MCAF38 TaxID=3232989 RepID=UPI003F968648
MTTLKKTGTSNVHHIADNSLVAGNSRALVDGMGTWLTAARDSQREMVDFVSKRLEKDSDTMRKILSSKNLTDAAEIQSRWIEETLRDYSSEVTKMITIYTKSGSSDAQNRNL